MRVLPDKVARYCVIHSGLKGRMMIYIKAFCGTAYHRAAYSPIIIKKRKRTFINLKLMFSL